MDRITLVELIEGETLRLSPRGRELWEELDPEEQDTWNQQVEIVKRMAVLLQPGLGTLDRLIEIRAGLYASDNAEERGELGKEHRVRSVILAAGLKDRNEGGQIDPMTVEGAVARLRQ